MQFKEIQRQANRTLKKNHCFRLGHSKIPSFFVRSLKSEQSISFSFLSEAMWLGCLGAFRNLELKIKSASQGADPDNELEILLVTSTKVNARAAVPRAARTPVFTRSPCAHIDSSIFSN